MADPMNGPRRFRPKTYEVEAWQFLPREMDRETLDSFMRWYGIDALISYTPSEPARGESVDAWRDRRAIFLVPVGKESKIVTEGEWVIRERDGSTYSFPPEVFEEGYTAASRGIRHNLLRDDVVEIEDERGRFYAVGQVRYIEGDEASVDHRRKPGIITTERIHVSRLTRISNEGGAAWPTG